MSINITVPLEALNDGNVARAMAELMLVLGRVGAAQVARPFAVPKPGAPVTAVAAVEPLPASEAPKKKRGRPPKPRPPEPPVGGTLEERFAHFMSRLPETSRQFLELVRQKKSVTMSEVMKEMGVTVPKTMGGITGSIGRWAPRRGLPIPYKAGTGPGGERYWTWVLAEPEETPKKKRGRPPKVKVSDASGEEGTTEQEVTPPSKKEVAVADEATADIPGGLEQELREIDPALADNEQFLRYLADTKEMSRRFVLLLAKRKELTTPEILQELGFHRANAMGGVIGPLKQRVGEYGLSVPFETFPKNGERAWRWRNPIGLSVLPPSTGSEGSPEAPAASPTVDTTEAERPYTSGVKKRRKGDKDATPL